MKLRLAVHAETREMPLILHAVVDRDDGERGLVLRFCDLSAEASALSRLRDPRAAARDRRRRRRGLPDHGAARGELIALDARTLVRGRETARGAARERDDVGADIARSGRPAQRARAVAAVGERRAARGERRAVRERRRERERAAAGSRPRTAIRSGRPTAALRSATGSSEGSSKPAIIVSPSRSSSQTTRVPEISGLRWSAALRGEPLHRTRAGVGVVLAEVDVEIAARSWQRSTPRGVGRSRAPCRARGTPRSAAADTSRPRSTRQTKTRLRVARIVPPGQPRLGARERRRGSASPRARAGVQRSGKPAHVNSTERSSCSRHHRPAAAQDRIELALRARGHRERVAAARRASGSRAIARRAPRPPTTPGVSPDSSRPLAARVPRRRSARGTARERLQPTRPHAVRARRPYRATRADRRTGARSAGRPAHSRRATPRPTTSRARTARRRDPRSSERALRLPDHALSRDRRRARGCARRGEAHGHVALERERQELDRAAAVGAAHLEPQQVGPVLARADVPARELALARRAAARRAGSDRSARGRARTRPRAPRRPRVRSPRRGSPRSPPPARPRRRAPER